MKKPMPVLTRIGIFLIIAISCVVFLPSLDYQFTNWDDDIHVTNNPAIHQATFESLAHLFRPTAKYMYHPLTMATYAIDWKTGEDSAWTFHATNIFLHLINIVLVFFLLRKFLPSDVAVLFGTAVFAVHPMQVESVAWISARKELLYAFFYLLSLMLYFAENDKKKTRRYIISIFFFFCSLLSKPTAVTLPIVIVLLEFWRTKKIDAKAVFKALPFMAISLAYAYLFIKIQNESALPPLQHYSFPQQALLIVYQVAFYVWKSALPVRLSACYAYPQLLNNTLPPVYYAAPVALVALAAALWMVNRRSKNLFPGLIFYIVTLSPVLQLVPFNNASLVADRYIYLPIIGIAFFFYQVSEYIETRLSRYAPEMNVTKNILCGLFILSLFVVAQSRIGVWKDSITLFNDVIEKNNHINIAYGNRANAEIQKGDFSGAVDDCNRLIEISPDNGKAFYNRGNAYSGLKLYREAVSDFTQSIKLGYTLSSVYYNRGTAYYHAGVIDSALLDYRSSEIRDLKFADAPFSIGYVMLHARKDPVTAIKYFDTALAIDRNHAEALFQKASAEVELRFYGGAMSDLAAAIGNQPELKNDSLVARINRSIDGVNTAIAAISDQIEKSPRSVPYRAQRGKLFLMLGDSARAALDMKAAAQYSEGGGRR